jgi:2-oxoglutarate ferredoxin oxidoreductase subunit gamma
VTERLLIAGSGGQGIILIGKLLATAALKEIPHITFFPAYGAEVRGGISNCQVILSSEEIASPISATFETMILMNPASVERYRGLLSASCLSLVNGSLCRAEALPGGVFVRATEIAEDLGDARTANLVMLGAYLARRPVLTPQYIEEEVKHALGRKSVSLIELNIKAFRTGMACVTRT